MAGIVKHDLRVQKGRKTESVSMVVSTIRSTVVVAKLAKSLGGAALTAISRTVLNSEPRVGEMP
jgi:hypothetical protein